MSEPKAKRSSTAWRETLPDDRYAVLFEDATEKAFSSGLHHEKRDGTYVCAACHQPLFGSVAKYESCTGWPSFGQPFEGAVETRKDFRLVWPRTEYHCSRCGGHQGHLFNDGPRPGGLRYCNNGLALLFVPADQALPEER